MAKSRFGPRTVGNNQKPQQIGAIHRSHRSFNIREEAPTGTLLLSRLSRCHGCGKPRSSWSSKPDSEIGFVCYNRNCQRYFCQSCFTLTDKLIQNLGKCRCGLCVICCYQKSSHLSPSQWHVEFATQESIVFLQELRKALGDWYTIDLTVYESTQNLEAKLRYNGPLHLKRKTIGLAVEGGFFEARLKMIELVSTASPLNRNQHGAQRNSQESDVSSLSSSDLEDSEVDIPYTPIADPSDIGDASFPLNPLNSTGFIRIDSPHQQFPLNEALQPQQQQQQQQQPTNLQNEVQQDKEQVKQLSVKELNSTPHIKIDLNKTDIELVNYHDLFIASKCLAALELSMNNDTPYLHPISHTLNTAHENIVKARKPNDEILHRNLLNFFPVPVPPSRHLIQQSQPIPVPIPQRFSSASPLPNVPHSLSSLEATPDDRNVNPSPSVNIPPPSFSNQSVSEGLPSVICPSFPASGSMQRSVRPNHQIVSSQSVTSSNHIVPIAQSSPVKYSIEECEHLNQPFFINRQNPHIPSPQVQSGLNVHSYHPIVTLIPQPKANSMEQHSKCMTYPYNSSTRNTNRVNSI